MKEVTDATLTPTQKNRILRLVTEYGPPAAGFRWKEEEQDELSNFSQWPYRVSVLEHRETGYYCIFGAHSIAISPGLTRKVEHFSHEDKIQNKEDLCAKWLVLVKGELEAPDLWASIIGENRLSSAASSATLGNQPFSAAEQSLIVAKLDEIKGYLLASQQFDAGQAEYIEENFVYLRESSERLGRKDWLNALLGALVGQAISLALSPEVAKGLLLAAGIAFQSLWGAGHNLFPYLPSS